MFSQYEEERYILEAVGHIPNGKFLDIGAYHPTVFSNTRALYERGWSGVMVEPSPEPFLSLLKEYGKDPRIVLLQAATTIEHERVVPFHATADAVSTSDAGNYEKWKDTANFTGKFWVAGIPLAEIFDEWGPFDFVNFDAEGSSLQLFAAMIEFGDAPTCVCVEYDNALATVRTVAASVGYREIHLNGTNVVLVLQ